MIFLDLRNLIMRLHDIKNSDSIKQMGGVLALIKDRLVFLRKEKNVLQADVAAYLSCSLSTISGYENGKQLPTDVILKLADYYDVSTDYLLCRTNERKNIKGDLQEMLDRLSRIIDVPFLTGMDIASMINAIVKYKQRGTSIGNEPIEMVRDFVLSMTQVLNAITDENVPLLIEQSDAALIAGLEASKIVSKYFQYINLFKGTSSEEK